jgi:CBS domain-containing protein
MQNETVQELLNRKGNQVACVNQDDTVLEAAKKMKDQQIGSVVVCDSQNKVVGIFTERDILRKVVTECKDPCQLRVAEVMSYPVACCKPSTTLGECQAIITRKRIRHLPVVENEQLLGIISSGDIAARQAEVQESTIEYLHDFLHGTR